ncbi:MAG: MFS transporter [Alphaproteobacteria bacterium]
MTSTPSSTRNSLALIIVVGCLMALISMGVRSSFGLFVAGAPEAIGVTSGDFGLALGWQNLLWGLMGAYAASLVDRFGPMWVLMAGAVMYGGGILGMLFVPGTAWTYFFMGVLVGGGVAATGFTIIAMSFSKLVSPEQRSWALGLGTAAASFGQFAIGVPAGIMLQQLGWDNALYVLAGLTFLIIPLSLVFAGIKGTASDTSAGAQSGSAAEVWAEIKMAFQHRGYVLLFFGFFVCGFHIAFIYIYLPKFLIDQGVQPQWLNGLGGIGAVALGLVGIFNIIGAYTAGILGQRSPKKYGLAFIYAARSVVMIVFIILPITPLSTLVFAAAMGLLWLSTVPLTQGIVAQVFGIRYMTTLYAIVFVSHQVGSFSATFLARWIENATGDLTWMWIAAIVMGVVAAMIHWPIDERPLEREATPAAA